MAKLLNLSAIAFAMLAWSANAQPTIKRVPVTRTNAASGAEMFKTYCAACHGQDGTGNGPAAEALKKAPANLTELAAKNAGEFPAQRVSEFIKGDLTAPAAHGSREMPVWGAVLPSVSTSPEVTRLRIANLTDYIQSIQKPGPMGQLWLKIPLD